ncbi:MAG: tetratricopeptide repeat protein [Proteobacteria bacterium]|nr:tetratricopeptide repeat protein [Pseudomonadota bacterium]
MSDKDAKAAPEQKKGGTALSKAPIQKDVELDGLMSEIESDLREDELKRLWRQHGSTFVVVAVLFLVAVAGYEGWKAYAGRAHANISMVYDAGMNDAAAGKVDDAKAKFAEVAKSEDQPYAALARLTEAGLRLQNNDTKGAVDLYAALAADEKADTLFRDVATILKALHSVDSEDPKKLEAEIAPLTKDSTFKASAIELTALLAAKQGDTVRAATLAQSLVDDAATPQAMRGRAQEYAALYKAGVVPATLPPPPIDAGKAPSVTDLVAPAAETEPTPARPAAKP